MKLNENLADGLAAAVEYPEMENAEENQKTGIDLTIASLKDAFKKSRRGIAVCLRIASLCYNSPEIKRLAELDRYGCTWMEDISAAACALENVDEQMMERIILSIKNSPELYDIRDIECGMVGTLQV